VNRRFDGVPHHVSASGIPVLDNSLAWFDCKVKRVEPAGDHDIVLGEVRETGRGTDTLPLLYFDGSYAELRAD
jgi:flavin reductase (DIM6/NTAB) family NADH-FMN oxidoreductase RutF